MSGAAQAREEALTPEAKAERIWQAIKPIVAEAVGKNSPRPGIKLDDIEANSAAAADAMARALMESAVLDFAPASDEEVEEAKREALKKAGPELASKYNPEDLKVRRTKQEKTVKTARGPVRCRREYLYFPDLKVGIFPPRHTA